MKMVIDGVQGQSGCGEPSPKTEGREKCAVM